MRAWVLAFGLLFLADAHSQGKQAEACFACHGRSGTSAAALTPSLGGQPSFFTVAQLFLFRDGRRNKAPTPMDEVARALSNDDLRAYGELFEKQPPPKAPSGGLDRGRFERGKGVVGQRNCRVCHNPDFSGREQMPRLANQREDYLLKALRDYRDNRRIGYGSATMPEELAGLADADLQALAYYLAHFGQ